MTYNQKYRTKQNIANYLSICEDIKGFCICKNNGIYSLRRNFTETVSDTGII